MDLKGEWKKGGRKKQCKVRVKVKESCFAPWNISQILGIINYFPFQIQWDPSITFFLWKSCLEKYSGKGCRQKKKVYSPALACEWFNWATNMKLRRPVLAIYPTYRISFFCLFFTYTSPLLLVIAHTYKILLRYEHGSDISRTFRKLWQTDRPTNRPTRTD